jgi:hypothetical protein
MKTLREPFDDELKEWLRNYVEAPDDLLWKEIVGSIEPGKPTGGWTINQNIIRLFMILMVVGINHSATNFAQFPNQENSKPETEKSTSSHSLNLACSDLDISHLSKIKSGKMAEKSGLTVNLQNTRTLKESISNDSPKPKFPHHGNNKPIELAFAELPSLGTGEKMATKIQKRGAQSSQSASAKSRKIFSIKHPTLYFLVGPVGTYQQIRPNRQDKIIIERGTGSGTFSQNRVGTRVDFGLQWPLTDKLKVYGGLVYFQQKQTFNYIERTLDTAVAVSGSLSGTIVDVLQNKLSNKSFEHETRNLGIPIGFNYLLSKTVSKRIDSETGLISKSKRAKRFLHWVGFGAEYQIAIGKTNGTNNFISPTTYLFGNIFYRIQYPDEGKLRFLIQPMINYSLLVNQNSNSSFYIKPYNASLNFGFTYDF